MKRTNLSKDAFRDSYMRLLFEESTIGLALCRMDGLLVDVNPEFARIIGRTVEETLGLTYWDLTPKAYADLERQQLESLDISGHYGPYEKDYIHKDGHLVPVRLRGSKLEVDGETYIWSSVEDITDRKQAEDALLTSQHMLQLVLDSIPVRVFWKDLEGKYLGCNRHFAKDAGLDSPEEITGLNDYELGWKEQAELYRADDAAVIRSGESKLNYEEPQTTPDGGLIWLRTSKVPLRQEDGKIVGVLGVYEDITDRKRALEELQESERRQAAAQRLAKIGHWDLDVPTDKLEWSREAYRIFEIDPREFDASYEVFINLVHPDDRELVDKAYDDSLKNRTPYSVEHRIVLPDGRIKHVQERCETFYGPDGQPLRSVGTVQDITDRVNLETVIRRSQKMEAVGQLSGGIAHDFNNHLSVIMGYLDMLKTSLGKRDAAHDWVDGANQAAERCANLTRRLLTFSGRKDSKVSVVNLNHVLKDLDTMIARAVTPEVEITYLLAGELWQVEIDVGELQDAILNLVINARDAMPGGGILLIESANVRVIEGSVARRLGLKNGDYVQLTFNDNGTGMSKETVEHMFEPFYTTKPDGKGTGLGLAMVYGFLKQYGGGVTVHSALGSGTTVRIYLPRSASDESVTDSYEFDEAELPTGNESILIVDDEVALLALAEQCLNKLGYRTRTAESAIEALSVLAENDDIDLLFSDIVMPGGMNGIELAREAVRQRPDLRVLLTSGFSSEAMARDGDDRFLRRLLSKPYRSADLAQRIRAALDGDT